MGVVPVIIESESVVNDTSEFKVVTYWENYSPATNPGEGNTSQPSYYMNDLKDMSSVYYAFLSLDQKCDPDNPHDGKWDAKCIRDTDSADCVMNDVEWPAKWPNPDAWLAAKVQGLYQACKLNNKEFIWSLGGEADLRGGLNIEDVDTLVN